MLRKKNWILLADGGHARVMERIAPFGKLKEIFNLSHTRLSPHEQGADRPGRNFESASPARHADDAPSDGHEPQKKDFAKELATLVKNAYQTKQFEELCIISPPHMLGLLRSFLNNSPVYSRIVKESHKDIIAFPLEEVQSYVDNLPAKR